MQAPPRKKSMAPTTGSSPKGDVEAGIDETDVIMAGELAVKEVSSHKSIEP